jgi:hypothetical protein
VLYVCTHTCMFVFDVCVLICTLRVVSLLKSEHSQLSCEYECTAVEVPII